MSETEAAIHDSRPDRIIFPDPTPKVFNSVFYRVYPRLLPILVMDNVQEFLRFCQNDMWAIALDFITPQTFLHMILQNSVRCAKVVLEGQAPELNGIRAYPNCATQYGFFPLHQAAEIFSVDMIKLLLQHGASTDVRTFGSEVVNDLLPLHVAVENTCMHKYLDDNLFPYELNPAYCKADTKDIYKLIHLLCLPEMKIFLDTTRLLAKHTNDLIGEICNYIRQGKLIHTAVLLLAAQGHIQRSRSCKRNGDRKPDGFSYIIKYIAEHSNAVKLEMVPNKREHQMVKEKYILSTLWLVEAISVAGGRLNEYIQGHSKVPHDEVLEHVSSILKSYDFCPTGESISIENLKLSPYNLPPPVRNNPKKNGKKAARTVATGEKLIVGKDLPRLWDLMRKRKSFFPFWRSALALGFPVKIYPGHAIDDKHLYDFKALCQNNVSEKACSPTPNHNIGLLTSTPQPTSNCQSKRQFGTSATAINYQSKSLFGNAALTSNYQSKRLFGTAALILLKVLKKA